MTDGTATPKAWMTVPAMLVGILSGLVFLAGGLAVGGEVHPITHTVTMRNNRFVPGRLTVSPGDTVTFVMASGGPHNVAFWTDSLPAGAALILAAGVPEPIDTLTGPLLASEGARYTVVFGAVPAGAVSVLLSATPRQRNGGGGCGGVVGVAFVQNRRG